MPRNANALDARQIQTAVWAWQALGSPTQLDTSRATQPGTSTAFSERHQVVFLGANAFPGSTPDANSRLSVLSCLAHELAHVERYAAGYRRPFQLPDLLLDEAETSIRASFMSPLSHRDREDLVEDARDRLDGWLRFTLSQERSNED